MPIARNPELISHGEPRRRSMGRYQFLNLKLKDEFSSSEGFIQLNNFNLKGGIGGKERIREWKVHGLFVLWTIRTLDYSYHHWTIRTMLRKAT